MYQSMATVVGVVLAGFVFASPGHGQSTPVERSGKALAFPDQFAWELFAELNQPAPAQNGTVQWENWALARRVYENPDSPPTTMRFADFIAPSSPSRADRFDSLPIQQQLLRKAREQALGQALDRRSQTFHSSAFDPRIAGQTEGEVENDEVRMNEAAFQTIVDHELYSIDGQEAAFESGKPFAFPAEAREIKAEWRLLGKAVAGKAVWLKDPKTGDPINPAEFHTAEFQRGGDKEIWGLVALHITTKDLPNWFWATWEHESKLTNPQREAVMPSTDRWGAKLALPNSAPFNVYDRLGGPGQRTEKGDPYPAGEWVGHSDELQKLLISRGLATETATTSGRQYGGKWTHYVLRGTQIDFTDRFGRPTILANSIIEEGFQDTSSCITCHSKAGIGPQMRRSPEKNRLPVFLSENPPVGDIGLPNPEWFFGARTEGANRKYLQFDFVWSTIRAKRKGTAIDKSEAANPLLGSWSYGAIKDEGPEVLGDGVLTITEVNERQGTFEGTLAINMDPVPWILETAGAVKQQAGQWTLLSFVGSGSGDQNNPTSGNFWSYRYEDVESESPFKLRGRVVRTLDHFSTKAAELHRQGIAIPDIVKQLGGEAQVYNRKGVSGTFRLIKLK